MAACSTPFDYANLAVQARLDVRLAERREADERIDGRRDRNGTVAMI